MAAAAREEEAKGFTSSFEPRTFASLEEAKSFVKDFAFTQGFAATTKQSWLTAVNPRCWMQCSAGGHPKNTRAITDVTRRRRRTSARCGCLFGVDIRGVAEDVFEVRVSHAKHNHPRRAADEAAHFTQRKLSPAELDVIRDNCRFTTNSNALYAILKQAFPDCLATINDVRNSLQRVRLSDFTGHFAVEGTLSWLQAQPDSAKWKFETEKDATGNHDCLIFLNGEMVSALRLWGSALQIECTHSTTDSSMSLLELTGMTNSGHPFIAAYVLLKFANVDTYSWALNSLTKLAGITPPSAVVTDREPLLMNAIRRQWPDTSNLLCRYRINSDVKSRIQDISAEDEDVENDEDAEEISTQFTDSWARYFSATNHIDADEEWKELLLTYFGHPATASIMRYIEETWAPLRSRFELPSVNEVRHRGLGDSGRPDCATRDVKQKITTCNAGLFPLLGKLSDHADNLAEKYDSAQKKDLVDCPFILERNHFFSSVVRKVSVHALTRVHTDVWSKRNNNDQAAVVPRAICNACSTCKANGWPCMAVVKHLSKNDQVLQPNHFDPHWHLHRDEPEARRSQAVTRVNNDSFATRLPLPVDSPPPVLDDNDGDGEGEEEEEASDEAGSEAEDDDDSDEDNGDDQDMDIQPSHSPELLHPRLPSRTSSVTSTRMQSAGRSPATARAPLNPHRTSSSREGRPGPIRPSRRSATAARVPSTSPDTVASLINGVRRTPRCTRCRQTGHNSLRCPEGRAARGGANRSAARSPSPPSRRPDVETDDAHSGNVSTRVLEAILLELKESRAQNALILAQMQQMQQAQMAAMSSGQWPMMRHDYAAPPTQSTTSSQPQLPSSSGFTGTSAHRQSYNSLQPPTPFYHQSGQTQHDSSTSFSGSFGVPHYQM